MPSAKPQLSYPAYLVIDPVTQPLTLYRLVDSKRDVLASLSSNYELQQPPRKIERVYAVIHMGISTFVTYDGARHTQQAWPKLGDSIARLELPADNGFCIDRPQRGSHRTLWGAPLDLYECVTALTTI